METPVQAPKPTSSRSSHPYPMVRSGGLFLLLVGAGVIGATLAAGERLVNEQIFFAGLGAAILSLFAARWISFGRGTRLQLTALCGALGIQAVLLVTAARVIGPMPEDRLWYRTMIIVGLHFLPMAIVFGPRMCTAGNCVHRERDYRFRGACRPLRADIGRRWRAQGRFRNVDVVDQKAGGLITVTSSETATPLQRDLSRGLLRRRDPQWCARPSARGRSRAR